MAYFLAPYSAISAISPAFERTRQYLFRPFRFWRFLKLALVACLVEAGGAGLNLNFGIPPGFGKADHTPMQVPHVPHMPWPPSPGLIALIATLAVGLLIVGVVLGYLIIRLRFAYFDRVLFMQDQIGPGWRIYHRQAMRYLGMSLCVGAVVLVLMGGLGVLLVMKYSPMLADAVQGRQPNLGEMLSLVLTLFLTAAVLGLALLVVDTALSYLVLPRMAVEDASIGEALRDVWSDVKAEPGQFALFMLMRLLLPAAAMLICMLVLIIPMVVLVVLAVLAGVLLHMLFAPGSILYMVVMGTVAAIIGIGVFFPAGIAIAGTLGTFVRNYALLFYAGRYPELGRLLWSLPPEPPPAPGAVEPAPG